MKPVIKDLGKVCITPEGDWDIKKEYANLSIVFNRNDAKVYISKQYIPKDIDILNTDYWHLLVDFDSIVNNMTALEIKNYVDAAIKEYIGNVSDEHNSLEKILNWVESLNIELSNNLEKEINNRISSDNDIKNKSVLFGSFSVKTKTDNINVTYKTANEKFEGNINIPAVTTEKAGVMTAEDKKILNEVKERSTIKITWDANSNINNFKTAGVYDIYGERTVKTDNLPIVNNGGGHSFNARLTVLDSSISGNGEDDDKCITQVLSFSNRLGQGEVYIRTGKGAFLDNLTWENWSTLQRNVNVGQVDTLDNLIDNGIYSGVYVGTGNKFTFVMVVINDYAFASKLGVDRVINQFLYAVEVGGHTRYTTRKKIGYAPWSNDEIINKAEIASIIANVVDNAIKGVIDNAPEAFDTLKEVADWIANDKTGAAAMATKINENSEAIRLNYEDIHNLKENKAERSEAMYYDTLGVNTHADKAEIYGRSISGTPRTCVFPAATTEKAGVMSAEDKREQVKKTSLVNGDIIAGQAREIHSRNGKTVSDSFLARTTAGSGTIGDGVASLKSVGGNIVKNLISQTTVTASNSTKIDSGSISIFQRKGNNRFGFTIQTNKVVGHKYYFKCFTLTPIRDEIVFYLDGVALQYLKKGGNAWIFNSVILTCQNATGYTSFNFGEPGSYKNDYGALASMLLIDLTEMFGAGNEPDKATCDRLFGTMDALPQGLSIAKPTEFKSTGFNQFNPDNVLDGKAIVNNALVSGDKKIAVIPCLPCKVGVGENNGYCIHGDFGDDIKVYLTPLNPMEVEGELYMHELAKDATTDTYGPQIKGYMLVEVPTTANLCAHFLWSEDKCERDTYEPYFESKVELPVIPQMSEWGLAGIQSSGTLVADTIDFERGVYIKRIGCAKVGDLNWKYTAEYNTFTVLPQGAPHTYSKVAVMVDKYPYIGQISDFNTTDNKVCWWRGGSYGVAIKDDSYSDVTSFRSANADLMLYYELAEPKEYPLPKVDNNYISSDYGVEQFDGVVPCNANNLYYMRSLAGETRNFLDRLYDNTDKTDAKEVADYITSGIESNKELAANAPNIALRALFVAAGAEYNDTDVNKVKTAPWGETVQHLPKHYYLNGLGDITEEQMIEIYNAGRLMQGVAGFYNSNINIRTNLPSLHSTANGYSSNFNGRGMFCGCKMLEVAIISVNKSLEDKITSDSNGAQYVFFNCPKVRYISKLDLQGGTSTLNMFKLCNSLSHVKIINLSTNLSFSDSPLIDKESILYLIQNNKATSAITITLHADAYARLAEDADIVAALEAQPLITLVSA